jgi:hypothetical protein
VPRGRTSGRQFVGARHPSAHSTRCANVAQPIVVPRAITDSRERGHGEFADLFFGGEKSFAHQRDAYRAALFRNKDSSGRRAGGWLQR